MPHAPHKTPYQVPFEVPALTYEEALAHLASIQKLGISPMLEVVIEMLDVLGRPDAHFDIIQIGGTNGKTSTSTYTEAVLRAHGLHTALYTSPELCDIRDRLMLDGARVSRELFATGIACAREAGERVNERRIGERRAPYDITEFDTITVASLVACALAQVDVAVLEVGMGGRWDATSATHPSVAGICGIALDHTHILGETTQEIAQEKVAIVKRGQKAFVLGQEALCSKDVENIMVMEARRKEVPLCLVIDAEHPIELEELEQVGPRVSEPFAPPQLICTEPVRYKVVSRVDGKGQELSVEIDTGAGSCVVSSMKPRYQAQNMAMACALAVQYLAGMGIAFDCASAQQALDNTQVRGRFEVLHRHPLHIFDAAHNPQGVAFTLDEVETIWPKREERPHLLCAIFSDKDMAYMVPELARVFPHVVVCETKNPRAMPASKLATLFVAAGAQDVELIVDPKEACEYLKDVAYIAMGSISLARPVILANQG